jgi:hypothetical protein
MRLRERSSRENRRFSSVEKRPEDFFHGLRAETKKHPGLHFVTAIRHAGAAETLPYPGKRSQLGGVNCKTRGRRRSENVAISRSETAVLFPFGFFNSLNHLE